LILKNHNISLGLIILIYAMISLSCSPVSFDPKEDRSAKTVQENADNTGYIKELIKQKQYGEAERELIGKLNGDKKNIELRKLLAGIYFKTGNYPSAEKFIRSILSVKPSFFENTERNENFDLYYIFITSLIRQDKTASAATYLPMVSYTGELNSANRTKYDIMNAEMQFRSENLSAAEDIIKEIFSKDSITEKQKLNLYYILSSSQIRQNKISSALDNAIFLILNDRSFEHTRKIKRLLDEIVNASNEDDLNSLKDKITDGYRELASRTEDNFGLHQKILREINALENSSVTVEMGPAEQNRSFISKVKLFADKDITSVFITSKDSIFYANPPMFDGKTLTLLIPGKRINSSQSSAPPPPGSGIRSVEWTAKNDTVIFIINLADNYDISIERSSGEEFEKSLDLRDRFSLKVNVHIPETPQNFSPGETISADERFTIVIDPGHGGDDPGALGVMKKSDGTRYTEKEMNLLLSRGLKKYLEDNGYRVFLTRDGDYYPSLPERNRIAQNRNADMFLSIHLNAASPKNKKYWQTDRYYGAEMIVRESLGKMPEFINFKTSNLHEWKKAREKALDKHRKLSAILSKTIPGAMKSPFNKQRKIVKKNLVIFSGMTIPHALIEAGFIINDKTLLYLLSKEGQDHFYDGVLKGIEEYRKAGY
jgi:N-acetylmuramoyl-L-alanine amidase